MRISDWSSDVCSSDLLALAVAVVYLAFAPKSNAVYSGYKAAHALVQASGSLEVPLHIRNAPTKLMKDLGYGKDYRYDHDEAGAVAAGQQYIGRASCRESGR